MTPVTQQMIWLIEQGLYGDNLRELARLAGQLAPSMPAVYVPLGMIFRALADEYDDQAIETARYQAVMIALQDPLLALLRAETSQPRLYLSAPTRSLEPSTGCSRFVFCIPTDRDDSAAESRYATSVKVKLYPCDPGGIIQAEGRGAAG
jgi:hypothetical protein